MVASGDNGLIGDPWPYEEACERQDQHTWRHSMEEEIRTIIKSVWTLTDLSAERKVFISGRSINCRCNSRRFSRGTSLDSWQRDSLRSQRHILARSMPLSSSIQLYDLFGAGGTAQYEDGPSGCQVGSPQWGAPGGDLQRTSRRLIHEGKRE